MAYHDSFLVLPLTEKFFIDFLIYISPVAFFSYASTSPLLKCLFKAFFHLLDFYFGQDLCVFLDTSLLFFAKIFFYQPMPCIFIFISFFWRAKGFHFDDTQFINLFCATHVLWISEKSLPKLNKNVTFYSLSFCFQAILLLEFWLWDYQVHLPNSSNEQG